MDHQCWKPFLNLYHHYKPLFNIPPHSYSKFIVASLLLLWWPPLLYFHPFQSSHYENQIITSSNLITHIDPIQLPTSDNDHLPTFDDHLPKSDENSPTSIDTSHQIHLSNDDDRSHHMPIPNDGHDDDDDDHHHNEHKSPASNGDNTTNVSSTSHLHEDDDDESWCRGKYVYMYSRLPTKFNEDMISKCREMTPDWIDVCSITSNQGLGPILKPEGNENTTNDDDNAIWYKTDHFGLDVIFHNRMKRYRCLTTDSAKAKVVYVPFYAGVDSNINLFNPNATQRDRLARELARWLPEQAEWKRRRGMDHFVVTGKISWDFRRVPEPSGVSSGLSSSGEPKDWGTVLLSLPEFARTMSVLGVEKSNMPEHARHEDSVPYPTYFHPRADSDITQRQLRLRERARPNLFAFAGAKRPEMPSSIRTHLIDQCRLARGSCELLEFVRGATAHRVSPTAVFRLFEDSVFCLQPPGDSYTRRSVFDAMMCACVPVLFHPHTAYTQYLWHLPKDPDSYSVFIPEDSIRNGSVVIEDVLRAIPPARSHAMRETLIALLPRLVYAHPESRLEHFSDAFDVALHGLIAKVTRNLREEEEKEKEEEDNARTRPSERVMS